ncbi:MAG: FAD-dependent monooxygenase [Mucilaginibacter sp.]|nr:FAD-dependent monooxygenase [Mucilaginibacter sp.]
MEARGNKDLLRDKKIAIVGAGPGGLTLARLLQLKGADVKVYERDFGEDARVQGSVVDLHYESGLKVIKAAGLVDAFKEAYMPNADKFRIVDKQAHVFYDEENRPDETFGDVNFRPEIDRGALRKVLLASLQPDTVVWDSHFDHMDEVDESWQLYFKGGKKATADIVIGADGARSKIRPYVTSIKSIYSGTTIIQGEIDRPQEKCPGAYALLNKGNLIALSDGRSISAQPRGDGGMTFYASARFAEDWVKNTGIDHSNKDDTCAFLVEFFAGWNPVFFELFNACDHYVIRQLNYFPLNQEWESKPNVTIIGDAAHLMPPSGEGVNTAMLDALDLSEYLTDGTHNNLQAAIAMFEKLMRARGSNLAVEALEYNELLYSENALTDIVRMFTQPA